MRRNGRDWTIKRDEKSFWNKKEKGELGGVVVG
jgi:hypothetical protein